MTRVALYARYSFENQKESSITDQFRNCEQRAAREGWAITARYEDKAISGSTAERPGYQRMLKDAEAKQFDILLVDDFSRLSRDSRESEQARRLLVYWRVRLIGVSDGIDTDQKGHKVLAGFKGLMNEGFLDDLRDRVLRGMTGQVLKGYHGGGRSYGYRLRPELDPSRTDPYGQPVRVGTRLELDPAQAETVRWIFAEYADGVSPVKIVGALNRQGVPPPGAAYKRAAATPPSWCASALNGNATYGLGLLNNRLYVGERTWGRARWAKDPDTKRKRRTLAPEAEWVRVPAPHLRIVDDAVWAPRQTAPAGDPPGQRRDPHGPARPCADRPRPEISVQRALGLRAVRPQVRDPGPHALWVQRLEVPGALGVHEHRDGAADTRRTRPPGRGPARPVHRGRSRGVQAGSGRLLAEHRRTRKPDLAQATARLHVVEQEIAYIMEAIKQGILTPTTKAELMKAEAERTRLLQTVQGSHTRLEQVATFLPNLTERFKGVVDDLATVTQHQRDKARGILRDLLGQEIRLHPTADGVERYLTAEVSGDYAGLFRLVAGKNKYGGGEGS